MSSTGWSPQVSPERRVPDAHLREGIMSTLPMVRRRGESTVLLRLAFVRIFLFPAHQILDDMCVNSGQWHVNIYGSVSFQVEG